MRAHPCWVGLCGDTVAFLWSMLFKCPSSFVHNNSANLQVEQSMVEWKHIFILVLNVSPMVNRGYSSPPRKRCLTDCIISSTPALLTLWIWCTSVSHNEEKCWSELTKRSALSPEPRSHLNMPVYWTNIHSVFICYLSDVLSHNVGRKGWIWHGLITREK